MDFSEREQQYIDSDSKPSSVSLIFFWLVVNSLVRVVESLPAESLVLLITVKSSIRSDSWLLQSASLSLLSLDQSGQTQLLESHSNWLLTPLNHQHSELGQRHSSKLLFWCDTACGIHVLLFGYRTFVIVIDWRLRFPLAHSCSSQMTCCWEVKWSSRSQCGNSFVTEPQTIWVHSLKPVLSMCAQNLIIAHSSSRALKIQSFVLWGVQYALIHSV